MLSPGDCHSLSKQTRSPSAYEYEDLAGLVPVNRADEFRVENSRE